MKIKKRYFIIGAVVVALIILLARYIGNIRSATIIAGDVSIVHNSGWDTIVSAGINRYGVMLSVDGAVQNLDDNVVYMGNNKEFMIKEDYISPLFSCAVNVYTGGKIIVEKAGNSLVMNAGSQAATYNEETVRLGTYPELKDGSYYVPISILRDYFAYDYYWDYMNNTLSLSNTKPDEKIYPFAYDYRKLGKVSNVKNQGDLGTCWAFAALTAVESTLMPEMFADFSVDNMSLRSGFNITQETGGDANIAMAYLLSWAGPVNEVDDPYGDGVSPEGLDEVYHVQEIRKIPAKDLDGIKKAIFLYGGVQSSIYIAAIDAEGHSSEYFNSEKSSYCYIGTEKVNHDVVIVGWDDSYSADNFSTVPEGDGAFICVNSWGTDFCEDGYFYVSYYDSGIGVHNVVYSSIESVDNYDKIYQSDLCGWVSQLGYSRSNAFFASVYTAEYDESLEAVGFYATGENTSYKVYFTENFKDAQSLNDRVLVAEGYLTNAGYYTIDLNTPCNLTRGTRFGVIVEIDTPGAQYPVAIENKGDSKSEYAIINDGESYLSLQGSKWEHIEETQNCNACLKAYTNYRD